MRFIYTLYPEARQKLEQSGLDKRIIAACKQESFPSVYGALYPDEFRGLVDDMKERGFYKAVPTEAGARYYGPLQDFARNVDRGACEWVVKRQDGAVRERAENEDFKLLSGYLASHVLTPEEFWVPERFGFSSIFELFGAVGAFAWREAQSSQREGYVWQSQAKGRVFRTQVTGDTHGDFRLFRTDLTPYETTDPLGYRAQCRPELMADKQWVSGDHFTELKLLVSALKYVEQEKLLATSLTQQGLDEIAEDVKALPRRMSNHADFGSDDGPSFHFACYRDPIPRLDQTRGRNPYWFPSDSDGIYALYVGPDRSLVFRYESREKNVPAQLALELPSEEIDHLIKSIVIQAACGLGRTSLKQVLDVLAYYFSPEFKEDQAARAHL